MSYRVKERQSATSAFILALPSESLCLCRLWGLSSAQARAVQHPPHFADHRNLEHPSQLVRDFLRLNLPLIADNHSGHIGGRENRSL